MKSGRGLIVERSGRRATALTRSGEFVTFHTDRDDLMTGMEVAIPSTAPLFTWRRLAPAMALAIVIVMVSSFGYQQFLYAQPVVAYVTVDSTGSIELEVNKAGIVKAATGIDATGQEALSSVAYMNKPAQEVVEALVKVQDPEKTSEVVVALVPAAPLPDPTSKEARKSEKAMEKLEKKVKDGAGSSAASLTSLRLDPKTREFAQELGISAGRAAMWALSSRYEERKGDPAEPGQVDDLPAPSRDDEEPGPEGKQPPGLSSEPPGLSSEPPGQAKKDGVLDAIKGTLPQVNPKNMRDLEDRKDAREREQFLKDLTKKWLDKVNKDLEKDSKQEDDERGREDKEDGKKPGPPGQLKKNNDKKGASENGSSSRAKPGRDSGGKGGNSKDTARGGKNDDGGSYDGGKSRSGDSESLLGDWLSRLPLWRK